MKIPNRTYRCPLGELQPTTLDADHMKHAGWHEHRILVVSADDARLDWAEREILKKIGERLYGRTETSHVDR